MKGWTNIFYRGLPVALLFAGACGSPNVKQAPRLDDEVHRFGLLGRAAYERANYEQAASLYERMLARARLIDSSREIGNAAYNLALCRLELHDYDLARRLLQDARIELGNVREPLGDVWLMEARTAYLQGLSEEAERLVTQGLDSLGKTKAESLRLQFHLLRALIAADRDDEPAARAALDEAWRYYSLDEPDAVRAGAAGVKGRVLLLEDDAGDAAQEFDLETALLRRCHRYDAMTRALQRSGEAHERAGLPAKAADRFFRAGRSLFAHDRVSASLSALEQAIRLAESGGDDELLNRAKALYAEVAAAPHKFAE